MKFSLSMQHVFYYTAGLISVKLISLLLIPITTKMLTLSEYGTLEVLLTFINLLSIILSFGLSDAIFRYGGTAQSPEVMEVVCSNAASLALIIGLVICIPIILLANKVAVLLPGTVSSLQVVYLGLALIPTNVLMVQLDWLRLKDNIISFVSINFFRAFFQALFVLITLKMGYGVTGIMFAAVISNGLIFLYFIFIQFKGNFKFNWRWQKRLFFYGLPLSFNGIAEFIILWLDNWWLAYVVGTAEMAKFALAIKFAMFTYFLIQPYTMWWYPKRFKYLNTLSEKKYNARRTELGVVFGFLASFFMIIASSLFIIFFIPDRYHQAISYIPGLCFMFALKNAGDLMNMGLYLKKTSYIMGINIFTAVLTVIGFYYLLPLWQAWGVILVLNVAFVFRWIVFVYLSQKELRLPYSYLKLFIVIILIGLGELYSNGWVLVNDYIINGFICLFFCFICSFKLFPLYSDKEC